MTEKNTDTQELLDGRESTYGNVVDNAARVAKIWNGYLGTDIITPADMMMMMALYKAYRFKVTPDYSDNINDVLGYAEIVRQIQEQTGGLIHAETVKEYLELKEQTGPKLVDKMLADLALHNIGSEAQANFHSDMPRHPYANVQRDEDAEQDEVVHATGYKPARESINESLNMEAWLRNRCGQPVGVSRCGLHTDHRGDCVGTL